MHAIEKYLKQQKRHVLKNHKYKQPILYPIKVLPPKNRRPNEKKVQNDAQSENLYVIYSVDGKYLFEKQKLLRTRFVPY